MHDTEFGSARKHYFQLFEGQVVKVPDLIVNKYQSYCTLTEALLYIGALWSSAPSSSSVQSWNLDRTQGSQHRARNAALPLGAKKSESWHNLPCNALWGTARLGGNQTFTLPISRGQNLGFGLPVSSRLREGHDSLAIGGE